MTGVKNRTENSLFCIRGAISNIYNIINNKQTPSSRSLKSLWEEDLSIMLENETWDAVLKRIHSSSVSTRHRLIQFKVVHRIHWSRVQLSRIFPDLDPTCPRCVWSQHACFILLGPVLSY